MSATPIILHGTLNLAFIRFEDRDGLEVPSESIGLQYSKLFKECERFEITALSEKFLGELCTSYE